MKNELKGSGSGERGQSGSKPGAGWGPPWFWGPYREVPARGRGVRVSEAALGQICVIESPIERSCRKSESWLQEQGRERCREMESMRKLEGQQKWTENQSLPAAVFVCPPL